MSSYTSGPPITKYAAEGEESNDDLSDDERLKVPKIPPGGPKWDGSGKDDDKKVSRR